MFPSSWRIKWDLTSSVKWKEVPFSTSAVFRVTKVLLAQWEQANKGVSLCAMVSSFILLVCLYLTHTYSMAGAPGRPHDIRVNWESDRIHWKPPPNTNKEVPNWYIVTLEDMAAGTKPVMVCNWVSPEVF